MGIVREVPREHYLLITGLHYWLSILRDPLAPSNILSNLPDDVSFLGIDSDACLVAHVISTLNDWESSVNDIWVEGDFLP